MSSTTLTFEALRKSNDRALEKRGNAPMTLPEEIKDRDRDRIFQLLEERVKIEDFASTQDQRESYGVEHFHREFVILRNLQKDACSAYEGKDLQYFVWSRIPHCPFKRFQELFCHEHQFVVPRFVLREKNRVEFPKGMNFHQMSLTPCLVSPDRISDDFAQNIGMCTFAEDDTPLMRLEKKRNAIPTLKLIFASAVPLQKGHQRLHRIEKAHPDLEQQYGTSVPHAALGTILYTRENGANGNGKPGGNAPQSPRRLVVSPFKSAYAASRKTTHEREGYDVEQLELLRLKGEMSTLNSRCNREWRGQIPEEKKQAIIADAQTLLDRGHELLEHCVNHCKVSADARIVRCGELLTKKNVSAAMATMIGTLNDLEHRLEPIAPIEGHNDQDRLTLHRYITEQELTMKDVRRSVVEAANVYASHPEITDPSSLGIDALALVNVSLQPFRTYANRMMEHLYGLDRALLDRNESTAQTSLIKMHVVGKFQAARTCFEHINLWLVEGKNVPVGQIKQFVGKLNAIFARREIFPESTVEGYEEPFEEMQQKLQGIEEQLARYAQSPLTFEQHKEMEERLKAYLGTFDIEEIVRELP